MASPIKPTARRLEQAKAQGKGMTIPQTLGKGGQGMPAKKPVAKKAPKPLKKK